MDEQNRLSEDVARNLKTFIAYLKQFQNTKINLEYARDKKQLKAYKHKGFMASIDTLNDKNNLEKIWISKKSPWKKWDE